MKLMKQDYFQYCGLLLILICLLTAACTSSQNNTEYPADMIVLNGQVLTVDDQFSKAEAFAVRDGEFVAVGSNQDIEKFRGDQTNVIDAEGKTVIPGLFESHVHAFRAARGEIHQPYVQLGSIEEAQNWLRERVKQTPADKWIQLPRIDVTRMKERRIPTREELDKAAPDHPAVFNWQYADYQIQILNSTALKAAGITKDTQTPAGGRIVLGEDGEPTGRLENSGVLTSKYLEQDELSEDEILRSLEKLHSKYNELGITSISERGSYPDEYFSYLKLKEQDRLKVRTTFTIRIDTDGTVEGTENAINSLPFQPDEGDEKLKVGPLKVRMDGGILYGTALMREPYAEKAIAFYGFDDPKYRGSTFYTTEEMTNIIHTGHRMGWQMSSHVTGEAAVDMVLDAIEAANADLPDKVRRYNFIHAYFSNPEAAERVARLDAGIDTQPSLYYKDGDALAEVHGEERISSFIGVDGWHRAGVKVTLNTDHMQGFDSFTSLNPYNPFLTMQVAVTRRTESGQVIGPDQKISREDALRMMTVDAAWMSFDENRRGSIEAGKLSDFAIISDDLLTCDEEEIKDIRSVLTVVGGEVVYDSMNN